MTIPLPENLSVEELLLLQAQIDSLCSIAISDLFRSLLPNDAVFQKFIRKTKAGTLLINNIVQAVKSTNGAPLSQVRFFIETDQKTQQAILSRFTSGNKSNKITDFFDQHFNLEIYLIKNVKNLEVILLPKIKSVPA